MKRIRDIRGRLCSNRYGIYASVNTPDAFLGRECFWLLKKLSNHGHEQAKPLERKPYDFSL
jgi:hypothetical protein